ncbi:MAG TPA: arylamine N-acetyltransferase [Holophagaceae bacterium]|jgi:N-hydroxyarylamine O-acetyltransferase|nr:arylamine N-acetyltransferase [Holophagaceae bacterium]
MASLDLSAYFNRTGFEGAAKPGLASLRALHFAHATSIPFENLAIQMGEGVSLHLDAIQDKLVRRRRGGYCFEQNSLFLAVLREIGFDVEPFEARVRGGEQIRPRTHMLLRVRLPEGDHLADVGFGGEGLLHPVLTDGEAHPQFGRAYRVAEQEGLRVLESRQLVNWTDLYAFEPIPRLPVDFEMGNWYTSTHPDSVFVKTLTAQRVTPEGRLVLRNLSFTTVKGDAAEERVLERGEVPRVLRDSFGLDIPDGTRFRAFAS